MRWFVGQWEVRPATPGCNEQCGLSEIGGRYFWSDVRGRMLIIRLGISTDHGARSFTPGTTCALIHRGLRSGNSDQPGHATGSVTARHTRKAGIDHRAHTRHGQGGFGDGGGDHDSRGIGRPECLILFGRTQSAVQRQRAGNLHTDLLNFAHARDEHEDGMAGRFPR